MAGTTYGANQKPFECPPAPAYYTRVQSLAFGRGFDRYVFLHRDGKLSGADAPAIARTRYQMRGLQQAFLEGWYAAKKLDT